MAESAVPQGILTAGGSWRRYAESTFHPLRIGRIESYAGNLAANFVLAAGRTQWGLLFPKLNVSVCLNQRFGPMAGDEVLFHGRA